MIWIALFVLMTVFLTRRSIRRDPWAAMEFLGWAMWGVFLILGATIATILVTAWMTDRDVAAAAQQQMPNRAAEIATFVPRFPQLASANYDQRLFALRSLCNSLNQIDGDNWGVLLQEMGPRTEYIPTDSLVWRPTLTYVTVVRVVTSEAAPLNRYVTPVFEVHGRIPDDVWHWQQCPAPRPDAAVPGGR